MSIENGINLKDKDEIFDLIKTSLDLFIGTNLQLGNNYITGEYNLSKFERKSYLLGKILDKNENYGLKSKLNNLLFSHGLKDNSYRNSLRDILKEIKGEQIGDEELISTFLGKLDEYLESIESKPLVEYKLIFPLNLNFECGIPVAFLQKKKDYEIQLVPQIRDYLGTINEYANNNYPRDEILDRNEKVRKLLRDCNQSHMHFFIVNIRARNVGFALSKALCDLGSNVGLYSFAKHYGSGMMYLSFEPFPSEISITKIQMPLVYVIENNVCNDILFTYYEKFTTPKKISLRELNFITNIISLFLCMKNEKLQLLLIEAFNYYYDALRASKYSIAFLNFWNIVERLLLKRTETTLKEIIKRLKSMYPDQEPTKNDTENLIDILYEKRNLFVHESKDTITSDDRDYMKHMVEHVIITLFNLRMKFDDIGMLEFFYQNLGKPLRIIRKEFNVLELLEKIKSVQEDSN